MRMNEFPVNPLDPEGSLRALLKKADDYIEFFENDNGHIWALTYRGYDPQLTQTVEDCRAYAMISPEKGKKPELAIMDTFVREGDPDNLLPEMIEAGFDITGYVDNRYTDLFGLVEEDTDIRIVPTEEGPVRALVRRKRNDMMYITPEEANEAKIRWYSEIHPPIEVAKQPIIDTWRTYKENVEKLLQKDYSDMKQEAQWKQKSGQNNPALN